MKMAAVSHSKKKRATAKSRTCTPQDLNLNSQTARRGRKNSSEKSDYKRKHTIGRRRAVSSVVTYDESVSLYEAIARATELCESQTKAERNKCTNNNMSSTTTNTTSSSNNTTTALLSQQQQQPPPLPAVAPTTTATTPLSHHQGALVYSSVHDNKDRDRDFTTTTTTTTTTSSPSSSSSSPSSSSRPRTTKKTNSRRKANNSNNNNNTTNTNKNNNNNNHNNNTNSKEDTYDDDDGGNNNNNNDKLPLVTRKRRTNKSTSRSKLVKTESKMTASSRRGKKSKDVKKRGRKSGLKMSSPATSTSSTDSLKRSPSLRSKKRAANASSSSVTPKKPLEFNPGKKLSVCLIRLKREASLNAAAKVNLIYNESLSQTSSAGPISGSGPVSVSSPSYSALSNSKQATTDRNQASSTLLESGSQMKDRRNKGGQRRNECPQVRKSSAPVVPSGRVSSPQKSKSSAVTPSVKRKRKPGKDVSEPEDSLFPTPPSRAGAGRRNKVAQQLKESRSKNQNQNHLLPITPNTSSSSTSCSPLSSSSSSSMTPLSPRSTTGRKEAQKGVRKPRRQSKTKSVAKTCDTMPSGRQRRRKPAQTGPKRGENSRAKTQTKQGATSTRRKPRAQKQLQPELSLIPGSVQTISSVPTSPRFSASLLSQCVKNCFSCCGGGVGSGSVGGGVGKPVGNSLKEFQAHYEAAKDQTMMMTTAAAAAANCGGNQYHRGQCVKCHFGTPTDVQMTKYEVNCKNRNKSCPGNSGKRGCGAGVGSGVGGGGGGRGENLVCCLPPPGCEQGCDSSKGGSECLKNYRVGCETNTTTNNNNNNNSKATTAPLCHKDCIVCRTRFDAGAKGHHRIGCERDQSLDKHDSGSDLPLVNPCHILSSTAGMTHNKTCTEALEEPLTFMRWCHHHQHHHHHYHHKDLPPENRKRFRAESLSPSKKTSAASAVKKVKYNKELGGVGVNMDLVAGPDGNLAAKYLNFNVNDSCHQQQRTVSGRLIMEQFPNEERLNKKLISVSSSTSSSSSVNKSLSKNYESYLQSASNFDKMIPSPEEGKKLFELNLTSVQHHNSSPSSSKNFDFEKLSNENRTTDGSVPLMSASSSNEEFHFPTHDNLKAFKSNKALDRVSGLASMQANQSNRNKNIGFIGNKSNKLMFPHQRMAKDIISDVSQKQGYYHNNNNNSSSGSSNSNNSSSNLKSSMCTAVGNLQLPISNAVAKTAFSSHCSNSNYYHNNINNNDSNETKSNNHMNVNNNNSNNNNDNNSNNNNNHNNDGGGVYKEFYSVDGSQICQQSNCLYHSSEILADPNLSCKNHSALERGDRVLPPRLLNNLTLSSSIDQQTYVKHQGGGGGGGPEKSSLIPFRLQSSKNVPNSSSIHPTPCDKRFLMAKLLPTNKPEEFKFSKRTNRTEQMYDRMQSPEKVSKHKLNPLPTSLSSPPSLNPNPNNNNNNNNNNNPQQQQQPCEKYPSTVGYISDKCDNNNSISGPNLQNTSCEKYLIASSGGGSGGGGETSLHNLSQTCKGLKVKAQSRREYMPPSKEATPSDGFEKFEGFNCLNRQMQLCENYLTTNTKDTPLLCKHSKIASPEKLSGLNLNMKTHMKFGENFSTSPLEVSLPPPTKISSANSQTMMDPYPEICYAKHDLDRDMVDEKQQVLMAPMLMTPFHRRCMLRAARTHYVFNSKKQTYRWVNGLGRDDDDDDDDDDDGGDDGDEEEDGDGGEDGSEDGDEYRPGREDDDGDDDGHRGGSGGGRRRRRHHRRGGREEEDEEEHGNAMCKEEEEEEEGEKRAARPGGAATGGTFVSRRRVTPGTTTTNTTTSATVTTTTTTSTTTPTNTATTDNDNNNNNDEEEEEEDVVVVENYHDGGDHDNTRLHLLAMYNNNNNNNNVGTAAPPHPNLSDTSPLSCPSSSSPSSYFLPRSHTHPQRRPRQSRSLLLPLPPPLLSSSSSSSSSSSLLPLPPPLLSSSSSSLPLSAIAASTTITTTTTANNNNGGSGERYGLSSMLLMASRNAAAASTTPPPPSTSSSSSAASINNNTTTTTSSSSSSSSSSTTTRRKGHPQHRYLHHLQHHHHHHNNNNNHNKRQRLSSPPSPPCILEEEEEEEEEEGVERGVDGDDDEGARRAAPSSGRGVGGGTRPHHHQRRNTSSMSSRAIALANVTYHHPARPCGSSRNNNNNSNSGNSSQFPVPCTHCRYLNGPYCPNSGPVVSQTAKPRVLSHPLPHHVPHDMKVLIHNPLTREPYLPHQQPSSSSSGGRHMPNCRPSLTQKNSRHQRSNLNNNTNNTNNNSSSNSSSSKKNAKLSQLIQPTTTNKAKNNATGKSIRITVDKHENEVRGDRYGLKTAAAKPSKTSSKDSKTGNFKVGPSSSSSKHKIVKPSKCDCDLKQIPLPKIDRNLLVVPKRKLTPGFHCGWSWEGVPEMKPVLNVTIEAPPVERKCYPAIKHDDGEIVRVRDCVLLKSGPRKKDVPFTAKVTAFWENAVDGDMMMSLLWYYRPEHTECGRKADHVDCELFASKHRDVNSIACIEEKCYVLTFNEYCRYRAEVRRTESNFPARRKVVPKLLEDYPRQSRLPPVDANPETVFLCRQVYQFRQKRILKKPS